MPSVCLQPPGVVPFVTTLSQVSTDTLIFTILNSLCYFFKHFCISAIFQMCWPPQFLGFDSAPRNALSRGPEAEAWCYKESMCLSYTPWGRRLSSQLIHA